MRWFCYKIDFLNAKEEIVNILTEAIQSDNPSKIHKIDRKYNYNGTISNLFETVKLK
jgi:hypothetical protein